MMLINQQNYVHVCVPMHKRVHTYSVNMCIYAHTCVVETHACIMCM